MYKIKCSYSKRYFKEIKRKAALLGKILTVNIYTSIDYYAQCIIYTCKSIRKKRKKSHNKKMGKDLNSSAKSENKCLTWKPAEPHCLSGKYPLK